MTHITVALPDDVAQQYYNASEKLASYLGESGPPPTPQTLMRFTLSRFTGDDIVENFDRTVRNLVGAPVPDEEDVWVFEPQFDRAS